MVSFLRNSATLLDAPTDSRKTCASKAFFFLGFMLGYTNNVRPVLKTSLHSFPCGPVPAVFRFLLFPPAVFLRAAPSKPPAAGTRGCASPRADDTSRCFFNNNLWYRRRSAESMTFPLWEETLPIARNSTPARTPCPQPPASLPFLSSWFWHLPVLELDEPCLTSQPKHASHAEKEYRR